MHHRVTVVDLHGDLDIATAPAITARLDPLTATAHPDLVVDLREVTFVDCSGLAALCRARRRTLDRGGRLRLVVDSPRLLRTLRATRLVHAFDVYAALPAEPVRQASEAVG
jgi:anti-sigma B factor antagonist